MDSEDSTRHGRLRKPKTILIAWLSVFPCSKWMMSCQKRTTCRTQLKRQLVFTLHWHETGNIFVIKSLCLSIKVGRLAGRCRYYVNFSWWLHILHFICRSIGLVHLFTFDMTLDLRPFSVNWKRKFGISLFFPFSLGCQARATQSVRFRIGECKLEGIFSSRNTM